MMSLATRAVLVLVADVKSLPLVKEAHVLHRLNAKTPVDSSSLMDTNQKKQKELGK